MTTPKAALELKPCPFCGGADVEAVDSLDFVSCQNCGASLEDSEPSARELWNTRATASLQGEDAVERVARIISRAMLDNPTGDTSEERAAKRKAIATEYAAAYVADLATGLVAGEAERPLGDVFNELVRRMNFDGMDPRTFTLGELERAIDGAEFPK